MCTLFWPLSMHYKVKPSMPLQNLPRLEGLLPTIVIRALLALGQSALGEYQITSASRRSRRCSKPLISPACARPECRRNEAPRLGDHNRRSRMGRWQERSPPFSPGLLWIFSTISAGFGRVPRPRKPTILRVDADAPRAPTPGPAPAPDGTRNSRWASRCGPRPLGEGLGRGSRHEKARTAFRAGIEQSTVLQAGSTLVAKAALMLFEPTRATLGECRPSPHFMSFRLNA
jgi:hypothetical protein